MKLTLHRAGGFAGSVGALSFVLDPAELPEPRRAQLLALMNAARVFEQPPLQHLASPQPWDFEYSLQLEDGGRHCTLALHLAAVNPALRDLVLFVEDESLRSSGPPD